MPSFTPTRRAVLAGSAAALGGITAGSAARAGQTQGDTFQYEVTRTEAEWRERLSDLEYAILRDGRTEGRRSSEFWQSDAPGTYQCKGCDLTLYESDWKTNLDIGWVFFHQSCENAILMSIDAPSADHEDMMADPSEAMIEAHCRRCGSHLGHILFVPPAETTLHCINGAALTFTAAEA